MYKDYTVFDIETNGLLEEVDMIHCLSYTRVINGVVHKGSIVDYDEIVDFIQEQKVLIGHNIIRYDIPVLKKLLAVKVDAILVDTLALSWYLFPLNLKHGLEEWGVFFGVPKPIIEDWDNLSIEDYLHRCNEDVRINLLLWEKQEAYLKTLYFPDDPIRIVNYLTFKLDCAREQEEVKIKLDVDLCTKTILELTTIKDRIVRELVKSMPKNILYKWANKPKNIYKADGNLTEAGKRWIKVLNDNSLPLDREEKVKVAFGEEDPNPDSPSQIKSWLFSLGWKPQEFKVNIHGKDIPQVRVEVDGEKVLCPSVVLLTKKEPSIEQLKQITILTHRLGILNGFLEKKDEYGKLKAEIQGLTNTLRFKHCKPLVNLPKVFKPYGEQIRGCLIADDNQVLCGSDMSSLEDSTKRHLMFFYDPEYVKQMMIPGFDPHMDIAVQAGLLTLEQVQDHKDKVHDYGEIRGVAKQVNFSCVYGAGPPKIASASGMSLELAQKLHKTYWERNWAVKSVASKATHKTVNNQMWLWNPISRFWYSLRNEKDKFSTLNQGLGVYCFDTQVNNVRKEGIKICGQFHDEIIFPLPKGKEELVEKILLQAIENTNDTLKLNVELGISLDFGHRYSDIH